MDDAAARADLLLRDALTIAIHDHRPILSDLPSMQAGGVTAKVCQIALDVDLDAGYQASRDRTEGWLRLAARGMEEALQSIENSRGQCVLALQARDLEQAREQGRRAVLLGAEGARWLEGSLEPLHLFHRLGLRELQLAWAFPTPLLEDGRLSAFGRQVLAECERLGIIVDLTHLPEPAFYEAVELAGRPLIVSHGAARGVTTDLDDGRLSALASTGGLLGVHFYTTYLGPQPGPEQVFAQVDYIAGRFGIEHVALGCDFFPTDGAWRELQLAQGTTQLCWAIPDLSHMHEITRCLLAHGYTDPQVRQVLGLNFLRVCKEVFEG